MRKVDTKTDEEDDQVDHGHGIINAHDLDGFPPAFYSLCAAVLHVRMTLPSEQLSPHHPTVPSPLVNSRIPLHKQP